MTMGDIEQTIKHGIGNHSLVHFRFNYLDCNSSLVLEAWEQIKTAVACIESGISDAKSHRAEALLLMILRECYIFHGYTPKEVKS